ncbi:hypothetical protein IBB56_09155 [Listeria welshimeri]|uniref:hypothetical protein n=1 Tax=Listeria welshimeri TaxID=1643 RepID=UPI001887ACAB|nr:hypothetical protein [Listeria welshimeri]MBF2378481.1 hypothetical protein [Listeria welshimeri]MBF2639158.1 hypothetical protein [Listeria welshimeri]MBF2676624.1 hypothetical protein [Listeria welshimeri]
MSIKDLFLLKFIPKYIDYWIILNIIFWLSLLLIPVSVKSVIFFIKSLMPSFLKEITLIPNISTQLYFFVLIGFIIVTVIIFLVIDESLISFNFRSLGLKLLSYCLFFSTLGYSIFLFCKCTSLYTFDSYKAYYEKLDHMSKYFFYIGVFITAFSIFCTIIEKVSNRLHNKNF